MATATIIIEDVGTEQFRVSTDYHAPYDANSPAHQQAYQTLGLINSIANPLHEPVYTLDGKPVSEEEFKHG